MIRSEELFFALEDASQVIGEEMQKTLILKALPDSYENFVCIENAKEGDSTFASMKKALVNYSDRRHAKVEDMPNIAAYSNQRVQGRGRSGDPTGLRYTRTKQRNE